jgi:hypothetical protein
VAANRIAPGPDLDGSLLDVVLLRRVVFGDRDFVIPGERLATGNTVRL